MTPVAEEAPVEAAEPAIESVGILSEGAIPSFPTEANTESVEFPTPAILSPEGLAPPFKEGSTDEEIEELDLFSY